MDVPHKSLSAMKKILVNHTVWQTRIAITQDGRLENIYYSAKEDLERSFFKGTVIKVFPGIQTAFIDIGQERAGFLHISDIDRDLMIKRMSKFSQMDDEDVPAKKQKNSSQGRMADISKFLKEGEPILVQVNKEPVYEKGAKLTTCFTLPGRFIVLMPNIPRIGISKKIENMDERKRLKEIVRAMLPEGMGCIIRTTSEGRVAHELEKDVVYLVSEWKQIEKKFTESQPKARLHDDLDISLQVVRDHLDDQVECIISDDKNNQAELYRFIKNSAPEYTQRVKLYASDTMPLFDYYEIEDQIEEALEKKVQLVSGGSLIIETTEAMTVIDVNTGKFIGKGTLEETILKTNLEAAEEVARQLRLRNIGGLIVIDFIDMAVPANRQKLFNFFEKILKERDKFQSVVLKISEFGLVQMTRKRSGKTLAQQLMKNCEHCHGTGMVKSAQTEALSILTEIHREILVGTLVKSFSILVHPSVFDYITANGYNAILEFERLIGGKITLVQDKNVRMNEFATE